MTWLSLRGKRPPIDTPVLVFRQGYDITGKNYWHHIEIAELVKPPYSKRLKFATNIQREEDGKVYGGFPLDGVTHWMLLPQPPPRSIAFIRNNKVEIRHEVV